MALGSISPWLTSNKNEMLSLILAKLCLDCKYVKSSLCSSKATWLYEAGDFPFVLEDSYLRSCSDVEDVLWTKLVEIQEGLERRKLVIIYMSVLWTWKNRQERLEQLPSEHSCDCAALLKPEGKVCTVRMLNPPGLSCSAKLEWREECEWRCWERLRCQEKHCHAGAGSRAALLTCPAPGALWGVGWRLFFSPCARTPDEGRTLLFEEGPSCSRDWSRADWAGAALPTLFKAPADIFLCARQESS